MALYLLDQNFLLVEGWPWYESHIAGSWRWEGRSVRLVGVGEMAWTDTAQEDEEEDPLEATELTFYPCRWRWSEVASGEDTVCLLSEAQMSGFDPLADQVACDLVTAMEHLLVGEAREARARVAETLARLQGLGRVPGWGSGVAANLERFALAETERYKGRTAYTAAIRELRSAQAIPDPAATFWDTSGELPRLLRLGPRRRRAACDDFFTWASVDETIRDLLSRASDVGLWPSAP